MIKVLAAEPRSKKRSGDEAFMVLLQALYLSRGFAARASRLTNSTRYKTRLHNVQANFGANFC